MNKQRNKQIKSSKFSALRLEPQHLGLKLQEKVSLVPRPSSFYLSAAFTVMHGTGRAEKNGEGLEVFMM